MQSRDVAAVTTPAVISRSDARDRALPLSIMVAGMAWLAFIAWFLATRNPYPFHGYEIYDIYYATILDGRVDLPPRTIRFEGWYAADGTAYMYHGVAPLLTRFAFGWVWPFEYLSMSGPSIWFWTALGTAGYQAALIGLARRAGIWELRQNAILLLCAGLWFAGPALLLASNQSFYHEPIAVSFGATGLFVAVWVHMARGKIALGKAVVLLALLAVIAFHARPNVAVALYAGTGLALCWGLWRYRATFLLPALLSGALLGAGVGGYLAFNEARFGSAAGMDGDYETTYGFRFWGYEDLGSARAEAFQNHGRFNLIRVLPNLVLYVTDIPPRAVLEPVSNAILNTYRSVTEPILGFIRIETPRIGLLLLWPVWLYLSVIGLWALRRDPPMAALAFSMALSFGLLLAYGTVTFRYRFDLWPLLSVLAFTGAVSTLVPPASRLKNGVIVALLCMGFLCSHVASDLYSRYFRESEENIFLNLWTYDFCADQAQAAGFEGADLARICREPSMAGM